MTQIDTNNKKDAICVNEHTVVQHDYCHSANKFVWWQMTCYTIAQSYSIVLYPLSKIRQIRAISGQKKKRTRVKILQFSN